MKVYDADSIQVCLQNVYLPTVIIVGADGLTGLTTARAIRNIDCCIIGLAKNINSPSCKSKVWDHILNVVEEDCIDVLLQLGSNFQSKPLILLSQDSDVSQFSESRERLSKFYRFVLPEKDVVDVMMDKTKFHRWANDNGFLVPKGEICLNKDDVLRFSSLLRYPMILKPLVRDHRWNNRYSNEKFFYFSDEHSLNDMLDKEDFFSYANRFILQEWIPGEDSDVYFTLFSISQSGRILAYLHGRKYWQWPPLGGSTALCTVEESVGLDSLSSQFIKSSGMKGLCSIEYKRDTRDGRYYMTEPTVGRNDHQSGLAIAANLNMTEMLVLDVFGMTPLSSSKRSRPNDILWVDEIACVRRIRYFSSRTNLDGAVSPRFMKWRRFRFLLLDLLDLKPFVFAFLAILRNR